MRGPNRRIAALTKRSGKFGAVLGLVGPNGAGKTTLIQCLAGLLQADSGEMRVFGHATDLNKPEWKLDIGYVGDVHVFWERWTAAKNLQFLSRFYPDWSHEKASELAKRVQLPLSKRAKDLSTGNRVGFGSQIGSRIEY